MATEQNVIPLARESVKEDTLQSRDSGKDGGDNTTDEEGRGDTKEATNVASTTAAAQSKSHQKKIGHRRVDETGQTTYKKTPSSALSGSIQLGISHTVAKLSSKPERDVLMQDFQVVETILFPSGGSNITPAHHFGDFTFRTYAPTAFRYFRDLFGIQPDDYMLSISRHPLVELSNPGASGSLFFVTHDDEFIIKTVLHKEAEFLQKLLPGYYMNLVQNPRTLLPKFYGLYNVQAGGKNIRVVVMNNLLPRRIEMHLKFDLKGSTFKRKASKQERSKKHPTFKDLDLLQDFPDGALLSSDIHNIFIKTLQRDCLVLQSFKIMDYSMLLAIHNIDQAERDVKSKGNGAAETCLTSTILTKDHPPQPRRSQLSNQTHSRDSSIDYASDDATGASLIGVRGNHSVMASTMLRSKYTAELDHWSGGIPAKNSRGEKLLLFCGIIDILQCYKFRKKLEHTWKSMIADGDTISVHRPKFYCERFQKFMADNVFRKDSSIVRSQPSRRVSRHSRRAVSKGDVQAAASSSSGQMRGRPDLLPTESPRPLSSGSSDESKGRGSSPRRMMSPHDRPERRSSNSAVMIAKGSKSEVVETTFSAISSIASRRSSTGSRTNSPTGSRQGSTLSRQASTASRKESPASSRKDSPSRKAIVNRPQVLESDVQHSPSKDRSATVSPATPNGQPSSPNRAATWSPNGASLHVDQVGVAVGGEMKEGTATTMTGGDSRDDSSSSDGDYVVVPGNPRRGRVTAL